MHPIGVSTHAARTESVDGESNLFDSNIPKLYSRAEMMVLQSDIAFQRPIAVIQRTHQLPIEHDGDLVSLRSDVVKVPLSERV